MQTHWRSTCLSPSPSPERRSFDAIVVGSGISGGWAAKELTERGLDTLLLERGRALEHRSGYITEHKAPWELPNRGLLSHDVLEKDYFIQQRLAGLDGTVIHYFFKDSTSRYVEEKPFTWIRGTRVGGKSIMWGRCCYRLSDLDFEANLREGVGVDWPIRYAELAPWYEHVERFAGISGESLGLPHLPDGIFQRPMPLTVVEQAMRERLRARFPDRHLTIARAAVLTEPLGDRAPCHYCGPCWRGCSTGSYFSSLSSTLPAAVKTGKLKLRADSIVHSVIFDERRGRASGVRVIDANTREMTEFRARLIFLCASTLGSTQILLNSTSSRFPTGLGNDSGVLGRFLMDHHCQIGSSCTIPGFERHYYYGKRPVGFYIPRFRNLSTSPPATDFLRGYGIEGTCTRPSWSRARGAHGFGKSLKSDLRSPGPWTVHLEAFGECLPEHSNHMRLHEYAVDSFGMPQMVLSCAWGGNELRMRRDIAATTAEMLEACGGQEVAVYDEYKGNAAAPGSGIHEMGTARMGRDPRTSVLNGFNQCHSVPNVFVTDGSCMPSSPCQNPSITYMALTARACSYAVEELKRQNL